MSLVARVKGTPKAPEAPVSTPVAPVATPPVETPVEAPKPSITDILFGRKPTSTPPVSTPPPVKPTPIPVLVDGASLIAPGTLTLGQFKKDVTRTCHIPTAGWVRLGIYETVGSDQTASFKVKLGSVEGACGIRAGHVDGTGPCDVQITCSVDTVAHVKYGTLSHAPKHA